VLTCAGLRCFGHNTCADRRGSNSDAKQRNERRCKLPAKAPTSALAGEVGDCNLLDLFESFDATAGHSTDSHPTRASLSPASKHSISDRQPFYERNGTPGLNSARMLPRGWRSRFQGPAARRGLSRSLGGHEQISRMRVALCNRVLRSAVPVFILCNGMAGATQETGPTACPPQNSSPTLGSNSVSSTTYHASSPRPPRAACGRPRRFHCALRRAGPSTRAAVHGSEAARVKCNTQWIRSCGVSWSAPLVVAGHNHSCLLPHQRLASRVRSSERALLTTHRQATPPSRHNPHSHRVVGA